MAFNLVVLTGRMVADPELKTTTNGISVCTFSIAVDRRYNSGEERQADFITIVAWRGSAEFVSKYFKKGDMIGIEGSIQTRKYQDKNGNNRTAFEVVANNVQFVGGKKQDNNSVDVDPENDPLNQVQDRLNEFNEVGNYDDDSDLPF